MELLKVWKAADPEINAVLAMSLSTLAFAAATFLTGWIKSKETEIITNEKARPKAEYARRAVKYLLYAFAAFSFLLAQSIFVDPIAVVGTEWTKLSVCDSISAVGGLGAGMFFFLRAALNIYKSAS